MTAAVVQPGIDLIEGFIMTKLSWAGLSYVWVIAFKPATIIDGTIS